MLAAWHDIWGCARGPARRLSPQARILVGAGVFAAVLIAPAATWPGAVFATVLSLSWLAMCSPPLRTLRPPLGVGLSVLLSSLLFIYLVALVSNTDSTSLAIYLGMLVWGTGTLVSTLAMVTVLSMRDLREGCLRLPVPAMVSGILLQMVHQTATLAYETRRMAAAMAVRGATSNRQSGFKILTCLPRVWLPRVIERADRIAAAMELRGYCEGGMSRPRFARLAAADMVGLALAMVAVTGAVGLRCWSLR